MNYLHINNMRFHSFHGVMANEGIVGGEYSVSFKIGYDFSLAAQKDDIAGAIDYGYVYQLVKEEMKIKSQLIEHVAQRIQDRVLKAFPMILTMETAVTKYNPPIEGVLDSATVVLNYSVETK